MELYDIIVEIAQIENGLAYGEINFTFDKLMCAMMPGHPADILDDIIMNIGNELFCNPDAKISKARLNELQKNLEGFIDSFGVYELKKPLGDLKRYIKEKANGK